MDDFPKSLLVEACVDPIFTTGSKLSSTSNSELEEILADGVNSIKFDLKSPNILDESYVISKSIFLFVLYSDE